MDAPCHTVTIDLESMAQTGLGDSFTALNLHQKSMHIGYDVVVDFGYVPGHDRTDQEPTESGGRLARQHHVPERHPTRGSERAGVPHLEFGEQ
jgi:hypothetical protein